MEEDSERNSQDVPLPGTPGHMEGGGLVGDHSGLPALCTLCRRSLAPEYEAMPDLETVGLCGDCKFLLLEDLDTPPQVYNRRRQARRRRNRQSSSESIENLFSQQFSHMITLLRQNQSTVSGSEDQIMDGGSSARSLRRSSSRTTPSSSRRWRRVISDSDSDGFDNLDSFYGESESNVSFSRYRLFRGESDAISFSTYGGDSDASMDGHSFLDTEIFVQAERSDINSDTDTDIDPMNAGLNQWNWDEPEEDDEGDEDGEWEEADAEEYVVGHTTSRTGLLNLFTSSPHESNLPAFNFRRSRAGFEQLLDHLAETDGSRRGAPPASLSFVNNLPRVIVSDEHEKSDGLACAICKDVLPVGAEVNQLPCLHVYHPSCILPWLSARNSCPLCRYELPTDDKDYEQGKQNMNSRMRMHESQQQNASEGNGEPGLKASNSRKRKAVPKAKTKDTSSSPSANASKVTEPNEASNEKRCKLSDSNGNENGSAKAEEDAKGDKANNTKAPEPPKDYIHVRARRGQATDSHSLAERVRREKISERMKLLQNLVPGCNKVTGKALMLDEIINYVQSLQRQVEFLSMKLASVNTRLDFNVESLMSKDIFQPNNTLQQPIFPINSSASTFFGHQPQQNPALHSNMSNGTMTQCSVDPLDTAICPKLNTHLPQINQFVETVPPQYPTFCEGDLETIVHMGLAQNQSQDMALHSQNFQGSNQVSHMKVEL